MEELEKFYFDSVPAHIASDPSRTIPPTSPCTSSLRHTCIHSGTETADIPHRRTCRREDKTHRRQRLYGAPGSEPTILRCQDRRDSWGSWHTQLHDKQRPGRWMMKLRYPSWFRWGWQVDDKYLRNIASSLFSKSSLDPLHLVSIACLIVILRIRLPFLWSLLPPPAPTHICIRPSHSHTDSSASILLTPPMDVHWQGSDDTCNECRRSADERSWGSRSRRCLGHHSKSRILLSWNGLKLVKCDRMLQFW